MGAAHIQGGGSQVVWRPVGMMAVGQERPAVIFCRGAAEGLWGPLLAVNGRGLSHAYGCEDTPMRNVAPICPYTHMSTRSHVHTPTCPHVYACTHVFNCHNCDEQESEDVTGPRSRSPKGETGRIDRRRCRLGEVCLDLPRQRSVNKHHCSSRTPAVQSRPRLFLGRPPFT